MGYGTHALYRPAESYSFGTMGVVNTIQTKAGKEMGHTPIHRSIHIIERRLFPWTSKSKALLMSWNPISSVINSSRWSSCKNITHASTSSVSTYRVDHQTRHCILFGAHFSSRKILHSYILIGCKLFRSKWYSLLKRSFSSQYKIERSWREENVFDSTVGITTI